MHKNQYCRTGAGDTQRQNAIAISRMPHQANCIQLQAVA